MINILISSCAKLPYQLGMKNHNVFAHDERARLHTAFLSYQPARPIVSMGLDGV